MRLVEDDEPFHSRVVVVAGHKDTPVGIGCSNHKDQASAADAAAVVDASVGGAAVAVGTARRLDKAIHWHNNALRSRDGSPDVAKVYLETSYSRQELVREGPYKSRNH